MIKKAKPVLDDEDSPDALFRKSDLIAERKSIADKLERIVSRLHTTDSEPLFRKMIKELRE